MLFPPGPVQRVFGTDCGLWNKTNSLVVAVIYREACRSPVHWGKTRLLHVSVNRCFFPAQPMVVPDLPYALNLLTETFLLESMDTSKVEHGDFTLVDMCFFNGLDKCGMIPPFFWQLLIVRIIEFLF